MNEPERHCPHCPMMEASGQTHTKNCVCGHHHADHEFAAGCRLCKCECYDQRKAAIRITVNPGGVEGL